MDGQVNYLKNQKRLARATTTIALCGIKFFFESTLKRDWTTMGIPRPRAEHKLPVVLSREEVRLILGAVTELRHRACLSLIYSCGLRLGEGCRLQVGDVDGQRGVIHVRSAKGNKDRLVPLPPRTLALLRECWKSHKNPAWIFPWVGRSHVYGPTSQQPVPLATVQQAFRGALKSSGVSKQAKVHSLRHSYATHLLEDGINPKWLGAVPGLTAVLHTWTRAYEYHPHIHCLITGGGLDPAGAWRFPANPGFLVSVHALSRVFRTRFRDLFRQHLPDVFAAVPDAVWGSSWVVHAKAVGSGELALRYLSRYIYRVALADSAILAADADSVTFRYRRSDDGQCRT